MAESRPSNQPSAPAKPSEEICDTFSPPESDSQWEQALLEVKCLLLNQQYKQCAQQCKQLISTASPPVHPIRATYLHYYAATASEYMGWAAYVHSSVKVPLLTDAMKHHQAAFESLPEMVPLPVPSRQKDFEPVSFLWSPTASPATVVGSPGVRHTSTCPNSASDAGVLWFLDSPTLSPGSSTTVASSPGDTPTPHAYRVLGPASNASVMSGQNLSSHGRMSPTPLHASSPSGSPGTSITIALCVTPPHAARGESRLDYNEPPPVCQLPPPSQETVLTPRSGRSRIPVGDQLVTFNSAKAGPPSEKSIVRDTARKIDKSISSTADADPFVNHSPTKYHSPSLIPVPLNPVRFPAELKDPVKQRSLIPSPLAIRKQSGDILTCRNSAVIEPAPSEKKTAEKKTSEKELRGRRRSRLPRLPLKVIPSGNTTANTEKMDTQLQALQPRRLNLRPTAAPSITPPSPPPSPSPRMQSQIPVLKSPAQSHPGSPNLNTDTDKIQSCSPTSHSGHSKTKSAAEIIQFNDSIAWLTEKIPHYVTELEKQIEHVKAVQQSRRARNTGMNRTVSFWTFSPVESGGSPIAPRLEGDTVDGYGNVLRLESKAMRRKRLKEEGWVVGFRSKHCIWKGSEYYDRLCRDALAELGSTGKGSFGLGRFRRTS
ncbi:hypothetical protein N7535_001595 [Penicillium sp. DV-2018c]|nr:hypothetical protein N7461_005162 [Penicillium sp. DV-2018c]KAJ5582975.1 hypothetical protein N7535_001595 [Penicillium sp. DV-2018c]